MSIRIVLLGVHPGSRYVRSLYGRRVDEERGRERAIGRKRPRPYLLRVLAGEEDGVVLSRATINRKY